MGTFRFKENKIIHRLPLKPQDWSIEGKFDKNNPGGGNVAYLSTGIGWYRKHFYVPAAMLKHEIKLLFDGIYLNSDVWINGHFLGSHPSGYTPVYYHIKPYLKKKAIILLPFVLIIRYNPIPDGTPVRAFTAMFG